MISRIYMRYTCSEEGCEQEYRVITKGMPRSKNGLFCPPTYICPFCDNPMGVEINDSPILDVGEG